MQLKKIEIQGFKSFADKTEVIFLDGITTIVGPNGSGKSNISDAVRWVLGEQSVKTLRGAKMEDVIFAGTEARKKVGFAEVSMYLDNSDISLPIEFKEVVVTRRVYRSGESNYLLNGSECRLKDIQELFMDTGVGRDGYSIISQGKIDEILSTKSEERRHIFEEASGIVKYRTRKDEATKKLDNTEISLNRVTDILNEIENIIGPLEKKAEIAKKYLLFKEELKGLDVRLFVDSINKNADELKKLDDIISTFETDIVNSENQNVEFEKSKNDLKERVQEISLKIEETQSKYFDLTNEIERLNSKIELSVASIENSNTNIERLNNEIIEDSEKVELLKEDIQKRDDKKKSMAENKIKFENELSVKQDELDDIMKTLDQKGVEIEKIKEVIENKNEEKYELKLEISSVQATLESNERQIVEKEKAAEKNISLKDSLNSTKLDLSSDIDSKNKELDNINKEIENISVDKNKYESEIGKIKEEENKLNQNIMTLKSKYNYLQNLEKENEGYFKSVKSALDFANESNMRSVYGTVASLVSTDEKYEYAIEIALGGFLQNIVVQDDDDAKKIIQYLKENKLGRVTFLPLSSIKKVNSNKEDMKKFDGFIGMAIDLVKYDNKYFDAINLSLSSTAIVDNVENAVQISKKLKSNIRIVTLSGELIASTGSITGGQTAQKTAGLIGRSEKIKELSKTIDKEQRGCQELTDKISKLSTILNELNDKFVILKQRQDELKLYIATKNFEFDNLNKEIQKIENAKIQGKEAIETIKNETKLLYDKIKQNEETIEFIDKDIIENQEIVDEYARFNKEKEKTIDFLNEDIVNLKISLSSFDESVSSIEEMKEKINQDINNFEDSISKKKNQVNILLNSIEENKKQIEIVKDKINSQDTFKSDYLGITEKLKKDKEECIKSQDKIETKIIETIRNIERLKEEKSKVENKKVKYDIEIENLKNKMWDEYELTISSSKKLLENISSEELNIKNLKESAEKIRKQIKDLGEVNVSSIEEYKETKERYDFITTQKLDLEETKSKLQNLINNMTTIMRQQFSKQFKIITENFNETFKELFGGGKAELRLSDENDVLNSGIEIEVQPPGKKLQSMMLLSGGERALTATALLFAILKIKTPPFCILDEIEAALDDVNVHRFAEYIKKYSNATQFIVITHRKGTMEVASSVYGVTMQEYGISKVISMKLK